MFSRTSQVGMLSRAATNDPITHWKLSACHCQYSSWGGKSGSGFGFTAVPFRTTAMWGKAYRVDLLLTEVQPGQKVRLPATVVAWARGAARKDVVLFGQDW